MSISQFLYHCIVVRLIDKPDEDLQVAVRKYETAHPIRKALYFLGIPSNDVSREYLVAQTILNARAKESKLASA